MRYALLEDTNNPGNPEKYYYVLNDEMTAVLMTINENCEECNPPACHRVIDTNPPLPPCVQQ